MVAIARSDACRDVSLAIIAMSLTLAVEWGSDFTVQAERQIEANKELLEARERPAWFDQLLWDLCLTSNLPAPSESEAVERLTANLDYHNSSIRHWMMDLGWTAHRWLAAEESTAPLLKNLADTLGSALMAAGLAAKLARSDEEFWARAQRFVPPNGFEDQYRARLDSVREDGILSTQAPFLNTEAQCRRIH